MKQLLFLHGAIGSQAQFDLLSNHLKNDFDILQLNFSGHGGREMPHDPFSIPLFANDVLDHLNEKNISSADIFGYSMGGYVALYLAKHFPQRVNKIFTLATKFDWSISAAEKESKMLIPEKIEEKLPEFAKQLTHRHLPRDWKIVLRKTAEMMCVMGADPPMKDDDFAAITHQVKLSLGDKDKMVSLSETKQVAEKIKRASMLLLPDTLHPIEQVSVEKLAHEIKQFFV